MDDLLSQIKSRLENAGFVYDLDWTKTTQQIVGGGTISINGKVIQQQGTPVTIKMVFKNLGECIIKDNSKEEVSLMCGFLVYKDLDIIQDLEINIYPNEYNYFNSLATQIFKI